MTTYSPTNLAAIAEIADRAATVLAVYDQHASVVADAGLVTQLSLDALELRRLRTVLVGLPVDDWQPADWETFTVEVSGARDALEVTP